MRYYPSDSYDFKYLKKLNAEEWMINVLKKNPNYCSWGNHEDYMWNNNNGWTSSQFLDSVDELWELNDLNELINFYFQIHRESEQCEFCEQSGYNQETLEISKGWYDFEGKGVRWCDNITQDEVDALWNEGRLQSKFDTKPSADEVNEWSKNKKGVGHDAINRMICVEQRAKRLGVYGLCEKCNGQGSYYISPKAKLQLQMWFIHPRKGAARGVLLEEIKEDELDTVLGYLKEARQRNWDRFSKL